jgi:hypothetical protein
MHYQNSTTYFHRVCIQSGIVRKKLGFEARCYIIVSYLNVGYNITIYLNVGTVMNQVGNSKFPPIGHLIFFFTNIHNEK